MSDSPFKFLRAGPPPPKVTLLPDALFFTRAIPIPADTPPAEVAAQVELALESLAPFPVSQLYHGYYYPPGAAAALVFAAYRRRFTGEQTELWADADLVLPTFAALLGAPLAPGTTLLITHAESLTALHAAPAGPAQIFTTPLPPATEDIPANEAALAAAKTELIRAVGGSTTVIDLATLPVAQPVASDGEFTFVAGDLVSTIPAALAAAIDVRDKDDLLARRRAHARDLLFWRVAVGCVLALALLAVGEVALGLGRGLWQKSRLAQLNAQKPTVDQIMGKQALANRIEELATKRLLPFEMITLLDEKRPKAILFQRTRTDGLYKLVVEAVTGNAAEITIFKTALEASPALEKTEITLGQGRDNIVPFTLTATFHPERLKPASSAP